MGKILSIFSKKAQADDIFLDFEHARPNNVDQEHLCQTVSTALENGNSLLSVLTDYKTGCAELIREAFSHPQDLSFEERAFRAVIFKVIDVKKVHEFSCNLVANFPLLLDALGRDNANQTLNDQQALAKSIADIISFSLVFDDLKAHCPQMQNDFAYYRRYQGKYYSMQKQNQIDIQVPEFDTDQISMFIAHGSPLVNAIITEVSRTAQCSEHSVAVLAAMANICAAMVNKRRFSNEQTYLFCLRAMTGAIVLYDHISPLGAFHRRSPIKIKKCIQLIASYPSAPEDFLAGLNNAIKHSTKNFSTCPSDVSKLLSA